MALFLCHAGLSQELQPVQAGATIQGRLYDSSQKKPCTNVVAALLNKDSTLLTFVRSRKDGYFSLDHLPAGTYIMLFTHPSYNEYSFPIILHADETKELGSLNLPPHTDLLAAVIVTPTTINPHMRGDTLEYNTAHVKMPPNASVEDLLRRLPGVQVDQNGVITINGQRIDRLLVDGEDFFSGDPTLVTRNFNADMIAKVQVLDKKSKKAEFTGIPDGEKTRTINLSLKEDSKQGYFTNGEAAHDLSGHYKANGLLGSFKDRRQFAALAMGANEGSAASQDLSGQTSAGISIRGIVPDPLGASAGSGIPTILAGGAHYANHWTPNEAHLSGDYQYGRLHTEPSTTSSSIQTLPDSTYAQQQIAHSLNRQVQQALSADLQYKVDSINSLQLTFTGSQAQANNILYAQGSSSFNDTLVNSSRRHVQSDVTNGLFAATLMWNRRGRKNPRRFLSLTAGVSNQPNTTNGMLYATNSFYKKDGSSDHADTIDQRKTFNTQDLALHADIGYGSPLWKGGGFILGYGIGYTGNRSLQNTFGKEHDLYDAFIDSLSDQYKNGLFTQTVSLNLFGSLKSLQYTAGAGISHSINTRKDFLTPSQQRYQYTNFNPNLNIQWNFDTQQGIALDYKGASLQPSITQLQPIKNNNDPLHITLGNPNLGPGFSHSFEMSYHKMGPIIINIGSRLNFTAGAFGVKTTTDSLGRQTSQAVNVDGNRSIGMFTYFSHTIKGLGLDLTFNPYCYYTRSVNYINAYLDHNDGITSGAGLGFNKYVPEKYSIQAELMTGFLSTHSSVNAIAPVHYWTEADNLSGSLFFLHGMEINSSGNYSWRQKVGPLDNNNTVFIWNAFVKRFFFDNRLGVRWQINDILNRNAGISRNINANSVTQNTYNVIGRYWMLSLSYRFIHHSQVGQK